MKRIYRLIAIMLVLCLLPVFAAAEQTLFHLAEATPVETPEIQ